MVVIVSGGSESDSGGAYRMVDVVDGGGRCVVVVDGGCGERRSPSPLSVWWWLRCDDGGCHH